MNRTHRRGSLWLASLCLALLLTTGCQTWTLTSGQTLPSGHYLEHPPQYFAPSPTFPHSREVAYQERVWAAPGGTGGNFNPGLPANVPPVPGGGMLP